MNATLRKSKPKRSFKRVRKIKPEEGLYWQLWKEIWKKFNVPTSEQSQWRKELRLEVLGSDRNQITFNHSDYDLVLGAMREILTQEQLIVYPAKLIEEFNKGQARRLKYKLEELKMPVALICAISRDKFGTTKIDNLKAHEMAQLLYTCNARQRSMQRQGKTFYDTPTPAIEDDNFPF